MQLCYAMLCYAMLCYLCYAMLCYAFVGIIHKYTLAEILISKRKGGDKQSCFERSCTESDRSTVTIFNDPNNYRTLLHLYCSARP
eukprot:g81493.t1